MPVAHKGEWPKLVMDGYVLDSDVLVSKMLSALSSVELVVGEVADAASMLGQKLPAELDAMLQIDYDNAIRQHVDGADTKEAAALCVTRPGTTSAMPHRAEVDALLAGG